VDEGLTVFRSLAIVPGAAMVDHTRARVRRHAAEARSRTPSWLPAAAGLGSGLLLLECSLLAHRLAAWCGQGRGAPGSTDLALATLWWIVPAALNVLALLVASRSPAARRAATAWPDPTAWRVIAS